MTREMILEALAHCVKNDCGDFCPMKEKDWINRGLAACEAFSEGETVEMPVKLIEHVIKLLKAQEPRVMAWDEVRAAMKAPIWKETKSMHNALYQGWVLAYDIQTGQGITGTRLGMAEPSGRVVWYKVEDYGKTWRCWSAPPTEAEREAAPWQ